MYEELKDNIENSKSRLEGLELLYKAYTLYDSKEITLEEFSSLRSIFEDMYWEEKHWTYYSHDLF